MIRFYAERLGHLFADLATLKEICTRYSDEAAKTLNATTCEGLVKQLLAMQAYCEQIRFFPSAMACRRFVRRLEVQPMPSFQEVTSMVTALQWSIENETEIRFFMLLPVEKAPRFFEADLFGPDVSTAFPEARFDIAEAGKCFAAGRNTATVLHLMRATEIALKALVRLLGSNPDKFLSWGLLIQEVERLVAVIEDDLKKNPGNPARKWTGADATFFASIAKEYRGVKDAFRNPTMHPERSYTEEAADDVFQSVRLLMKTLASRLAPAVAP